MTLQHCKLGLAALMLLTQCGQLYAFPDRPLALIVPFPATGTPDINGTPRLTKLVKLVQTLSTPSLTDALAQEVAFGLGTALERTVLWERRAGGMGADGVLHVARALPDGHSLLFADHSTLLQHTSGGLLHDLAAVAPVAAVPLALVGEYANQRRTVRQLIEAARFAARQVNFAALGETTTAHFASEAFFQAAGIHGVRVNYNGSIDALNAVATRNVEFGFVPLTAVLPFVSGGKLRIIALTSPRRHPAVPDTPTIAESGVDGFAASGWFGIFAPLATPRAIVARLNGDINRLVIEDNWQRTLFARGLFPFNAEVEVFRAMISRERLRLALLAG